MPGTPPPARLPPPNTGGVGAAARLDSGAESASTQASVPSPKTKPLLPRTEGQAHSELGPRAAEPTGDRRPAA